MKTFFENLLEAGAKSYKCANGIAVELCNRLWVFTDTEEPVGLWGDSNGSYVSVPLSTKKPVVLVERENISWGTYTDVQFKIPLDGTPYRVFC